MTITWEKLLTWFYYITTVVFLLGVVMNVADNQSDIYQIWVGAVLLVGSYLISRRK